MAGVARVGKYMQHLPVLGQVNQKILLSIYIGEFPYNLTLYFSILKNWKKKTTVKVVCMNKTVSVGCFICTKAVAAGV